MAKTRKMKRKTNQSKIKRGRIIFFILSAIGTLPFFGLLKFSTSPIEQQFDIIAYTFISLGIFMLVITALLIIKSRIKGGRDD